MEKKKEIVLFTLIVVIILLAVGLLFKHGIFTVEFLAGNKEFVSVTRDLISLFLLITGGILSYFRFFKGRTFSSRGEINFEVTLLETPKGTYFHVITVKFKNIGNYTIWNPIAKFIIQEYNEFGLQKEQIIEKFHEQNYFQSSEKRYSIVDSGETAFYVISREFDKSIWAVTYVAEVTADNKRTWQNSITIPNKSKNG